MGEAASGVQVMFLAQGLPKPPAGYVLDSIEVDGHADEEDAGDYDLDQLPQAIEALHRTGYENSTLRVYARDDASTVLIRCRLSDPQEVAAGVFSHTWEGWE